MDQIKIGRFIAACRKQNGLTQLQLAERLNITDRAVSKWETGKSMPDSSIMLELCQALQISVNDLLCGEVVAMQNYDQKLEETLLELVKQKEDADRRLLALEIFIASLVTVVFLALVFVASYAEMADWLRVCLIAAGFVPFIAGCLYALRIEQVAGYYECAKCGHRYVPTYKSVFLAAHVNRTRRMRCPKCGEKSWQKKVLRKESSK